MSGNNMLFTIHYFNSFISAEQSSQNFQIDGSNSSADVKKHENFDNIIEILLYNLHLIIYNLMNLQIAKSTLHLLM